MNTKEGGDIKDRLRKGTCTLRDGRLEIKCEGAEGQDGTTVKERVCILVALWPY